MRLPLLKALTPTQWQEVEGELRWIQEGEKAHTYKVDLLLLEACCHAIADKFCDMSMATKLNKYSELIKSAAKDAFM